MIEDDVAGPFYSFFFFLLRSLVFSGKLQLHQQHALWVMKSDVSLIGSALSALIYMCIEAAFPRNAH